MLVHSRRYRIRRRVPLYVPLERSPVRGCATRALPEIDTHHPGLSPSTVDSTSGGLPRAPHEEAWCHHFVDFLAPMGKKRGAHKPDVKPVDATTPSPDRCASPAPEDPFQMAHAASLPPRVTTWLHVCVSRVGRIGWRGAGLGRVDTALLMRMTRESPRITHRYTPPVVRIFRSSTSPWS